MPTTQANAVLVNVLALDDVAQELAVLERVISEINASALSNHWRLQFVNLYQDRVPFLDSVNDISLRDTQSDVIFIAIVWHRWEESFGQIYRKAAEYLRKQGKQRVLVYRCMRDLPFKDVDPVQLGTVKQFVDGITPLDRSEYITIADFEARARQHLQEGLRQIVGAHTARPEIPKNDDLARYGGPNEWAQLMNFTQHPFGAYNADVEKDVPEYYYDWPYFAELVGGTNGLAQTALVFGMRGIGKTALRRKIENYNLHPPDGRRLFTITYTDVSPLFQQLASGGEVTARDHVQLIISQGLIQLADAIERGTARLLADAPASLSLMLGSYVHLAGPTALDRQHVILEALHLPLNTVPADFTGQISAAALFGGFCKGLRAFGYERVHVLIDRVDESADGRMAASETIRRLFKGLLNDLTLLQPADNNAVFFFFLNDRYREPLEQEGVRLGERLRVYKLEKWSDDDLLKLIEARLSHFSRTDGFYTRMAQLADPNDFENLDEMLVREAQGIPRRLIMLCNYMISEHCRNGVSESDLQLRREDFDKAVERVARDWIVSETQPVIPPAAALPAYQPLACLPTPLAVPLAQYQAASTPSEKLQRAAAFTQYTLQLLTGAALALVCPSAEKDLIDRTRNLLFNASRPPSLGDWRQTLFRLLDYPLTDSDLRAPLEAFRSNSRIGQALNHIIEQRNNHAHSRLSDSEARAAAASIDSDMQTVVTALEPLCALRLAVVDGVSVNSDRQLLHHVAIHRGNTVVPETLGVAVNGLFPAGCCILVYNHDVESASAVELTPFVIYETPEDSGRADAAEMLLFERLTLSREKKSVVQYISPVSRRQAQRPPHQKFIDCGLIQQDSFRAGNESAEGDSPQ